MEYSIFRHTQMIFQHSTRNKMLLEKAALQYVAFSGTNIDGGCQFNPRRWFCVPSLKLEMLGDPGERRDLDDGQGMSTVSEIFFGPAIKHMASWEILQSDGSMKIINTCGFCIATFDYQSVLKIGSMKLRREHEYKMYLIVFGEIMLHPYLFQTYLCQR